MPIKTTTALGEGRPVEDESHEDGDGTILAGDPNAKSRDDRPDSSTNSECESKGVPGSNSAGLDPDSEPSGRRQSGSTDGGRSSARRSEEALHREWEVRQRIKREHFNRLTPEDQAKLRSLTGAALAEGDPRGGLTHKITTGSALEPHQGNIGTTQVSQWNPSRPLLDSQRSTHGIAEGPSCRVPLSRERAEAELTKARLSFEPDNFNLYVLGCSALNRRRFDAARRAVEEGSRTKYLGPNFEFQRPLVAHPAFCDLGASEALAVVNRIFEAEATTWEDEIPFEDVYGNAICDLRADFWGSWDKVKRPLFKELGPQDAVPFVERWPLECSVWSPLERKGFGRTVALCFWLAKLLEPDRQGGFFLSGRVAGKLLGIDRTTAAIYLRQAIVGGFLEIVEKGGKGMATQYSFLFESVEFTEETLGNSKP